MTIKHVLLSLGVSLTAFTAMAQVEDDDMYFNAKDREKVRATEATESSALPAYSKREDRERESERYEENENVNPTDSYSSRNVNPEYDARSHAEVAQEDEANYFVNDYRYNTSRDLNNFNDNYSSWSGSPWYNSNYYGSSINSFYSPYYGCNGAYNSPWGNPYWGSSGWSASFSYGWGNNYGYWNNPYGYGYNNPYRYGYYDPWGYNNGFYNNGFYNHGWYGGGYPGTIVVVNNGNDGGRYVTYGKRPTRGGANVSSGENSNGRSTRNRSTATSSSGSNNNGNTNGRIAGFTPTRPSGTTRRSSSDEYYSRTWRSRNDDTNVEPRSGNSSSGYSTGNRSSRSSSNSNASDNSGSTYTPPSRSSNSSNNSNSGSTYTPPSRSSNSSNSGSTYTPPSRSSSSGSGSSYTPSRSSSGGSSSGSSGSSGGSRGRTRGN